MGRFSCLSKLSNEYLQWRAKVSHNLHPSVCKMTTLPPNWVGGFFCFLFLFLFFCFFLFHTHVKSNSLFWEVDNSSYDCANRITSPRSEWLSFPAPCPHLFAPFSVWASSDDGKWRPQLDGHREKGCDGYLSGSLHDKNWTLYFDVKTPHHL